ncbi:MAG: hypothetical protein VYD54_08265 [Bdellovibrionota bacterium]|nr:hypothetical protein [Bdellovibrionota bacterium]
MKDKVLPDHSYNIFFDNLFNLPVGIIRFNPPTRIQFINSQAVKLFCEFNPDFFYDFHNFCDYKIVGTLILNWQEYFLENNILVLANGLKEGTINVIFIDFRQGGAFSDTLRFQDITFPTKIIKYHLERTPTAEDKINYGDLFVDSRSIDPGTSNKNFSNRSKELALLGNEIPVGVIKTATGKFSSFVTSEAANIVTEIEPALWNDLIEFNGKLTEEKIYFLGSCQKTFLNSRVIFKWCFNNNGSYTFALVDLSDNGPFKN